MSRLYEFFHQIMEAPACLRSVTVLLMVGTLLTMIPLGWVCSEGSEPPEVGQVLDHTEELLVGYGKGCEGWPFWAALFFLPSVRRPWPVRKFGTSFRTTSGCLTDNQDLLGGCAHVVLQHRVFARAPEQVVHRLRRLLSERFEEWGTWTNVSFEDLKDNIHAVSLYL